MPIGVIVNTLSIAVGGLLGALFGKRLSEALKEKLNLVFSVSAMGMGVSAIVLMKGMPAVILALILGTLAGHLLRLQDRIRSGGVLLQKGISKLLPAASAPGESEGLMITALVLFCASGTGIYGSIVSGMSGDHSILIAKSVLDLFTAMIFACTLGASVSLIAVPQVIIFLSLFFLARVIGPLTTDTMAADFKACGGFILIATGLRIAKIRDYPIGDMIPAMLLVWPLSAMWTAVTG